MQSLPTVLLRHTTRAGGHYDWLLADPLDPTGLLWTARCDLPSEQWLGARTFAMKPIQPHRRVYLTYEGPISGGRGSARRVDEGTFVPRLWTASRIVIDVNLRRCRATIEMTRITGNRWRAMVRAAEEEAQAGEPREIGAAWRGSGLTPA